MTTMLMIMGLLVAFGLLSWAGCNIYDGYFILDEYGLGIEIFLFYAFLQLYIYGISPWFLVADKSNPNTPKILRRPLWRFLWGILLIPILITNYSYLDFSHGTSSGNGAFAIELLFSGEPTAYIYLLTKYMIIIGALVVFGVLVHIGDIFKGVANNQKGTCAKCGHGYSLFETPLRKNYLVYPD